MIEFFAEMLSYPFLVRAIVVGLLISLCAAILGVSLVLKRYSMIGDGLSHVGFGTLAIAAALGLAPLTVSVPLVVLAAFLLLRISESSKIKGDAAIAFISTTSLAAGVIIISFTNAGNTDIYAYMFGSISSVTQENSKSAVILALIVLALFVFFYNKIFAVTFDENFVRATGRKAGIYNMIIAFLTAITIVVGMRIMGALLISGFIIFPALTSMRVFKKFKSVVICSAIVSASCFMTGITLSYVYATPPGASIIIINVIVFSLFWTVSAIQNRPD